MLVVQVSQQLNCRLLLLNTCILWIFLGLVDFVLLKRLSCLCKILRMCIRTVYLINFELNKFCFFNFLSVMKLFSDL